MLITRRLRGAIGAAMVICGSLAATSALAAETNPGQQLAFDRKKGNCLACHMIPGGEAAGNIAPPLIAMKARFPDRAKLRAQVWDATKNNADTSMPPFGRHQILSEQEIDQVVDFIWSL